jgi:hypothetical protein
VPVWRANLTHEKRRHKIIATASLHLGHDSIILPDRAFQPWAFYKNAKYERFPIDLRPETRDFIVFPKNQPF